MTEDKTRDLLDRLFDKCNELWVENPTLVGEEMSELLGEIQRHLIDT